MARHAAAIGRQAASRRAHPAHDRPARQRWHGDCTGDPPVREPRRDRRTGSDARPAGRKLGRAVGPAVIDEAQKEPAVFDKVKLAYDERQIGFSVLLGSSRLLLLDRVCGVAGGTGLRLRPLAAHGLRAALHGRRDAGPSVVRSSHHGAGLIRGDPGRRAAAPARRRGHAAHRGTRSPRGLGRHARAAVTGRRRPPRVAALLPADVARARPPPT